MRRVGANRNWARGRRGVPRIACDASQDGSGCAVGSDGSLGLGALSRHPHNLVSPVPAQPAARLVHPAAPPTPRAAQPFTSAENALQNINDISEGIVTSDLKAFLEANLPPGAAAAVKPGKSPKFLLGVAEPKIGTAVQEALGGACGCGGSRCGAGGSRAGVAAGATASADWSRVAAARCPLAREVFAPWGRACARVRIVWWRRPNSSLAPRVPRLAVHCNTNETIAEIVRGVRLHFPRYVSQLAGGNLEKAQLGLAHSYSRAKVKFNVHRADNMIIQVSGVRVRTEQTRARTAPTVRDAAGSSRCSAAGSAGRLQ